MKGPKIVMQWDHKRIPENVSSKSSTIPDDSYSILDLFNRHRQGAPLPVGLDRTIVFGLDPQHEDLDLERIRNLDIVDINTLYDYARNYHTDLSQRQKDLLGQLKTEVTPNDDQTTKTPPEVTKGPI